MPNKTIYVREADREIWEKAEKLAGGSVSALITQALKRFVEEDELIEHAELKDIEVELAHNQNRDGWEETTYQARFVGRWLLEPDPDETRTGEPGYDAGAYYGVAVTKRNNIAVYVRHVNDGFAPTLNVYDSFEQAAGSGVPDDILARAAAEIDASYVRELDI